MWTGVQQVTSAGAADTQIAAELQAHSLKLSDDLISLSDNLQRLATEHIDEHQAMVNLVRQQSKLVAHSVWGGEATVRVYGSRAVGLALPASDIDVVLLPAKQLTTEQQTEALAQLGQQLQNCGGWETGRVTSSHALLVAAMPLLKVRALLVWPFILLLSRLLWNMVLQ